MTATSHQRGHRITWTENGWVYGDDSPASEEKPCARCGRMPTPEGYDACLGHLEDVTAACCGHGVEEPYILERVKHRRGD